jgi:hypothetical protein
MSVEEITASSNGSIVVVTFRRDGDQAIAERTSASRVTTMDLDFGFGATIASDQGI